MAVQFGHTAVSGGPGSSRRSSTLKPCLENVMADIVLFNAPADDKVAIEVTFTAKSKFTRTKKSTSSSMSSPSAAAAVAAALEPVVSVGTTVSSAVVLPSIMQTDSELVVEYLENLANNLLVEYDENTGRLELRLRD